MAENEQAQQTTSGGGVEELLGWESEAAEAEAGDSRAEPTLADLIQAAIGGGTRAALGRQLGVTSRTIKNWLLGRSQPGPHARRRLAALLGVSPEEIQAAARRVEPPYRKLGEKLRAAREERGWTLQEASEELFRSARQRGEYLHVGTAELGEWERGVRKPARRAINTLRAEYGDDVADEVEALYAEEE